MRYFVAEGKRNQIFLMYKFHLQVLVTYSAKSGPFCAMGSGALLRPVAMPVERSGAFTDVFAILL